MQAGHHGAQRHPHAQPPGVMSSAVCGAQHIWRCCALPTATPLTATRCSRAHAVLDATDLPDSQAFNGALPQPPAADPASLHGRAEGNAPPVWQARKANLPLGVHTHVHAPRPLPSLSLLKPWAVILIRGPCVAGGTRRAAGGDGPRADRAAGRRARYPGAHGHGHIGAPWIFSSC